MNKYKYLFFITLAALCALLWRSVWQAIIYRDKCNIYKDLAQYQAASSVYGIWEDLSKAYIIENAPTGPKLSVFPRTSSTNYSVEVDSDGEEQYTWYTEDGVGANTYSGEVSVGDKSVIIEYRHDYRFADLTAYKGPGLPMGMDGYRIEASLSGNNTLDGTIVHITDKHNINGRYSITTNRFLAGRRIINHNP